MGLQNQSVSIKAVQVLENSNTDRITRSIPLLAVARIHYTKVMNSSRIAESPYNERENTVTKASNLCSERTVAMAPNDSSFIDG